MTENSETVPVSEFSNDAKRQFMHEVQFMPKAIHAAQPQFIYINELMLRIMN